MHRYSVLCLSLVVTALLGTAAMLGMPDDAGRRRAQPQVDIDAPPLPTSEHDARGVPAARHPETSDSEMKLQRIRPPQWHRFLPGMFR